MNGYNALGKTLPSSLARNVCYSEAELPAVIRLPLRILMHRPAGNRMGRGPG
jgi:hypothetical protein